MRGKGRIAAIASKYFHLEGDVESVLRKIQNSDWKSSAPKSHSRVQKLPNKTEDAFTQFWVPNSLCTLCKWRQRALHWAQEAIIFKRWLPSLLTALTMEERKAAFHIRGILYFSSVLLHNSSPTNNISISKLSQVVSNRTSCTDIYSYSSMLQIWWQSVCQHSPLSPTCQLAIFGMFCRNYRNLAGTILHISVVQVTMNMTIMSPKLRASALSVRGLSVLSGVTRWQLLEATMLTRASQSNAASSKADADVRME